VAAIEVTDVIRYGVGAGSRIELAIGTAGHLVRLRLLAKDVLSYGRIAKAAMEQGLVLPYERSANRAWRKVLARAMERARFEPLLEGEEIADAVAEEIKALLEAGARGESASDLTAGKVVEVEKHLLVSPNSVVLAVRRRLVDDVLSKAMVAESAVAHLGMRQVRHRFADSRPRAWAFPLPLVPARENRVTGEWRVVEGASSNTGKEGDGMGESPDSTERSAGNTGSGLDPVHGPEGEPRISPNNKEVPAGSTGPTEKKRHLLVPLDGEAVLRRIEAESRRTGNNVIRSARKSRFPTSGVTP
jgi:hypothetical protein